MSPLARSRIRTLIDADRNPDPGGGTRHPPRNNRSWGPRRVPPTPASPPFLVPSAGTISAPSGGSSSYSGCTTLNALASAPKDVYVGLRVPSSLAAATKVVAQEDARSVSFVIREALVEHLKTLGFDLPAERGYRDNP